MVPLIPVRETIRHWETRAQKTCAYVCELFAKLQPMFFLLGNQQENRSLIFPEDGEIAAALHAQCPSLPLQKPAQELFHLIALWSPCHPQLSEAAGKGHWYRKKKHISRFRRPKQTLPKFLVKPFEIFFLLLFVPICDLAQKVTFATAQGECLPALEDSEGCSFRLCVWGGRGYSDGRSLLVIRRRP